MAELKMNSSEKNKILIIAGELSGDFLGGELISAFKKRGNFKFYGTGGPLMTSEGIVLWESIDVMSAVGFTEVVRKYFPLRKLINRICKQSVREGIDFAVLIDYPGFNIILARKLHKLNIPVYFYVSPQIWAWHYRRIYKYKKYGQHIFCLFPFEVDIYQKIGMSASYHGHPLAKRLNYKFQSERPLEVEENDIEICFMPGSRIRELEKIFPIMLQLAFWLYLKVSPKRSIHFYFSCIDSRFSKWMKRFISVFFPGTVELQDRSSFRELEQNRLEMLNFLKKTDSLPNKKKLQDKKILNDAFHKFVERCSFIQDSTLHAIKRANFTVTSSGTSTLEIAFMERPMIILYKVSPITAKIVKRLIKIPYIGMVNILEGKFICREFLQEEMTLEKITKEADRLLNDSKYRNEMIRNLKKIHKDLSIKDPYPEIVDFILNKEDIIYDTKSGIEK
jgi:lipid-A-disaccharide synthase